MSVSVFVLERDFVQLAIAEIVQNIGSLRRFGKILEFDSDTRLELKARDSLAHAMGSPVAAMVADVTELPLATAPATPVRAHVVLGWDEGRTQVTDFCWDFLPILGYAVRPRGSSCFILHEYLNGVLFTIDQSRARELGLVSADGVMVRRGQPLIKECYSVRHVIDGYAEADCILDDGRTEKLLFGVDGDILPDPSWLKQKKPTHIGHYSI